MRLAPVGELIDNLKQKGKTLYQDTKTALRDTSLEIIAGGLLGAVLATGISYNHEADRANKIPLAFSERSQLRRAAQARGEDLGPMTEYLTATNDTAMKVFECWNLAHENSNLNTERRFAIELENKMDPAMRIHADELYTLLPRLSGYGQDALDELVEFRGARDRTHKANGKFTATWDDDHDDVYRTEVYTETESYSCGTSDSPRTCTRTVTKTRQVYDHTIHTYTFFPKLGEEADKELKATLASYPDLRFKEQLPRVKETGADNELAMDNSRHFEKGKYRLDKAELLQGANTWNAGATITAELPNIYAQWRNLHADQPAWNKAKQTAESDRYNTYSHSDPGPAEFQIAEAAVQHSASFVNSVDNVVNAITFTQNNATQLETAIRRLIAVELDHKEGNGDEIAEQILDLTKRMYQENFSKGFDLETMRWGYVFGFGLLGLMLGAGAGAGLDQAGKRFGWYDSDTHTLGRWRSRNF